MDIKQYVIDFIEGRVDADEFIKACQTDPTIFDWIQSVIPSGMTYQKTTIITEPEYERIDEIIPYNIRIVFDDYVLKKNGRSYLAKKLNFHGLLSRLIMSIYPEENIKEDESLSKLFCFMLDACPEYLLSPDLENSGILDDLLKEFSEVKPRTKKVKAFKEKLKAMFFVEGQKYPRWIQSSEWPLSKTGKPTKFLRQKSKGEISYYYFLDVDTGEEIEIMQAY